MNKAKLREDLRSTYNKYAPQRDTGSMPEWKIELRLKFLRHLQEERKQAFLEIGAGTGRDSRFFHDQGLDVVCIDLSPAMVKLCRQKGLTAYVMDMADIAFPSGSFDAIYSMNSLLHLTKAEFPDVLRGIARLLRRDGIAFIGMYGGLDHEGIWEEDSYHPKRFFSFFTDAGLRQRVAQGFDILSFESIDTEPEGRLHFQALMLRKKDEGGTRPRD